MFFELLVRTNDDYKFITNRYYNINDVSRIIWESIIPFKLFIGISVNLLYK